MNINFLGLDKSFEIKEEVEEILNKEVKPFFDFEQEELYYMSYEHNLKEHELSKKPTLESKYIVPLDEYNVQYECSENNFYNILDKHSTFPQKTCMANVKVKPLDYNIVFPLLSEYIDTKIKKINYSGGHLSLYESGDYIGIHTNASKNSDLVYCAFVYCEEGNKSFFRYYNKDTKKITTINEKKGWNINVFKVGIESNPSAHCVYSDTKRMSVVYCGEDVL